MPPTFTSIPGNTTLEATSPAGATYNYSATATDNVGTPTVSCNPVSGSTFPFLVSGGSGKYSAIVGPASGATGSASVSVSGGTVTVSFGAASHGDFNVNVTDGANATPTAVIHCT